MVRRNKLEIMRDILKIVKNYDGKITITPLIRRSNLSSNSFYDYYKELIDKKFIKEVNSSSNKKVICILDKGYRFLEKYASIISFIEEFEL